MIILIVELVTSSSIPVGNTVLFDPQVRAAAVATLAGSLVSVNQV